MIRKMDPPEPFSPVVPKSGIQGDALTDAGARGASIHRKKREKEEPPPGVRVRLSEKHRGGAENAPEADLPLEDEGPKRKKIDVLA